MMLRPLSRRAALGVIGTSALGAALAACSSGSGPGGSDALALADYARPVGRLGYTIDMGGLRSRGPADRTLIELFNIETVFHVNQPGGAELEWNFLSQVRRLPNGAVIKV
jgi:hypothetical protein